MYSSKVMSKKKREKDVPGAWDATVASQAPAATDPYLVPSLFDMSASSFGVVGRRG